MQIWIYFNPGAGGDGFANLLERSRTITPVDQNDRSWRIHRFVDNIPKFWSPTVDQNKCFRTGYPFKTQTNRLNQKYVDCVNSGADIVCTSHDTSLQLLEQSDFADLFLRNQIKVALDHQDPVTAYKQFAIKNLQNISVDVCYAKTPRFLDFNKFDYVVNIEKIQTDWNYVSKVCGDLNIELDQQEYLHYQSILVGSSQFDQPGIERYQSSTVDGRFCYNKIN